MLTLGLFNYCAFGTIIVLSLHVLAFFFNFIIKSRSTIQRIFSEFEL